MVSKRIITQPGQSLIDIAIQEYQATEGMFLLMLANQSVVSSLTTDLEPGTELQVWPVKVVKQVVERTESLAPYLGIIMQWIAAVGAGSGGGTGGNLNDGDYVHIRGDEVVSGIKTFVNTIQTLQIEEIADQGISVEGIYMKDGVLDAGTF
ncbi:MAG: hypothetical protein M0Q90_14350 [Bacteroidales bacterium]|nr:hypothetical protein [Bacteroidales bacterium]